MAGKTIIQEHSFWEIWDGSREKLWEESWNQFPILGRVPRWDLIKQQEFERGRVLVNQSWGLGIQMDYHRWNLLEKPNLMSAEDWVDFQKELNKHFVKT